MLTEERLKKIMQLIQNKGAVTVTELTKLLDTSESTVRRDLTSLAKMEKLEKVHGGATLLKEEFMTAEEDMVTKSSKFLEEKIEIARYAISMIRDQDFIFIDAGTTTEKLVDCIEKSNAVFVTNGVSHIKKLTQKGCQAYILGGQFKLSTDAIVGSQALKELQKYNFSKVFIGTNGIHKERGLTTPDTEEAMIKREAIEKGIVSFTLADHSKFERVSAVQFAALSSTCIITDKVPDASYRDAGIIKEVVR